MSDSGSAQNAPAVARVQPIRDDEWTGEHSELLKLMFRHPAAAKVSNPGPADAGNLTRCMLRHPELFKAWMSFAIDIMAASALPKRERELIVLRTGWRCQAPYEWGQHVRTAHGAGLTEDEVERVTAGPDAPGWTAHESALLRAVDELHDGSTISESTWADLARTYTPEQLIEMPLVCGWFHLQAFVQNAIAVTPEPGVGGLESR